LIELSSGSATGRVSDPDISKDDDEDGDNDQGERELADATLKLIRLLANLCINEVPGTLVSKKSTVLEVNS
jgi:hypothetical protein